MFEMLDAFIGLIFIYTILSLIVTTLMETLIQFEGLRGKNLKRAVGRLLEDDSELLETFYAHQRIMHLQLDAKTLPSHVPDDVFRQVLMETLTGRPFTDLCARPFALYKSLQSIENLAIRTTLLQFWSEANGNVDLYKGALDLWFNHTRDRASGWFKKMVRKRLFLLGLVVAIAANADTLHMFQNLMADKGLRDAYVTQAMGLDQAAFDQKRSVLNPDSANKQGGTDGDSGGVEKPEPTSSTEDKLRLIKIAAADVAPVLGWKNAEYTPWVPLGWLLTAIALSLGAPFWFDILQKVVKVRSSLKPDRNDNVEPSTSDVVAEDGVHTLIRSEIPQVDLEDFSLFEPQRMSYVVLNAFWMVRFAELAYKEEMEIKANCMAWGLECEFHSVASENADTQYFFAYNNEVLILAFRGTEASRIPDLITDLNAARVKCGWNKSLVVHKGFQHALSVAWPVLEKRLAELHEGRYLWIGGHSLGGALAALAGSCIAHISKKSGSPLSGLTIGGLYTCGQPRAGDQAFADDLDARLGGRYCRVVNNRDIVPTMPPPVGYAHSGSVLYLNETGRLMVDPPLWYRALDKLDYTKDQEKLKARLKETVTDHGSVEYVRLLSRVVESSAV